MAYAALVAAAGAPLPDWNDAAYSGSTDLIPISTSAVAPNSIPGASRVARLLVNSLFKVANVTGYVGPVKKMIKTIEVFIRHWGSNTAADSMSAMATARFGYANANAIGPGLLQGLALTAESLMVSTPEVTFVFRKYDTMVSQVMQAHGINPTVGNPLFWGYATVALHNGAFAINNNGVPDTPATDTPALVLANPNGVPKALEVLSRILGYNIPYPHAYIIGQAGPNISIHGSGVGKSYKRRASRGRRSRDGRGRFTRRY